MLSTKQSGAVNGRGPSISTDAIIMAGGSGKRMRESGHTEPKPLVRVGGVPLIERNLFALFRHNFRHISVAVAADVEPLRAWLLARGTALASAAGASLRVTEEIIPLGSIGAAALARRDCHDLLIVFADNLTALDLRALVEDHHHGGAAMTMAVHEHPFRIPFGAPEIRGNEVIGFCEKPTFPVVVCSGAYVLGSEALDLLPYGEPCGAPTLIDRLLAAGRIVRPYLHEAAWIDVNEHESLIAAERLLAANPDLDRWATSYHREVAGALVFGPRGLLLEWRQPGGAYPGRWDTPAGKLEPGESPLQALLRELSEELGMHDPDTQAIGSFDDIDSATASIQRHHVFVVQVGDTPSARKGQGLRWFHPDELMNTLDIGAVAIRSLAIWASKRGESDPP